MKKTSAQSIADLKKKLSEAESATPPAPPQEKPSVFGWLFGRKSEPAKPAAPKPAPAPAKPAHDDWKNRYWYPEEFSKIPVPDGIKPEWHKIILDFARKIDAVFKKRSVPNPDADRRRGYTIIDGDDDNAYTMLTVMPKGSNNEVSVGIRLPDEWDKSSATDSAERNSWQDNATSRTPRGSGEPILHFHYKNHGEGDYTIYSATELRNALDHLYKMESDHENERKAEADRKAAEKAEKEAKRRAAVEPRIPPDSIAETVRFMESAVSSGEIRAAQSSLIGWFRKQAKKITGHVKPAAPGAPSSGVTNRRADVLSKAFGDYMTVNVTAALDIASAIIDTSVDLTSQRDRDQVVSFSKKSAQNINTEFWEKNGAEMLKLGLPPKLKDVIRAFSASVKGLREHVIQLPSHGADFAMMDRTLDRAIDCLDLAREAIDIIDNYSQL